jgi:hypothetical protein
MGTKRLAELEPGDVIRTNEGRREWLRIINISEVDETGAPVRYALMHQMGGQRRGWRFPMNLHDYDHGWTVR